MTTDSDEMLEDLVTKVRTATMAPIIVSRTAAIAEIIELMP